MYIALGRESNEEEKMFLEFRTEMGWAVLCDF
jgi:hypothetical protein